MSEESGKPRPSGRGAVTIQSFPHDESRFERLMQSRAEKAPRMNGVEATIR